MLIYVNMVLAIILATIYIEKNAVESVMSYALKNAKEKQVVLYGDIFGLRIILKI